MCCMKMEFSDEVKNVDMVARALWRLMQAHCQEFKASLSYACETLPETNKQMHTSHGGSCL